MGTAATIDPVVERFRQRLVQTLRVTALIWFGSRAAGGGAEWSDYDLIVVSPDFEKIPFLQRAGSLYDLKEPRAAYDLLCYTPREFEDMASSITIVREAVETGVRVI